MATPDQKSTRETNENFGLPETDFQPIAHPKSHRYLRVTLVTVSILLLLGGGLFYWFLQSSTPTEATRGVAPAHPSTLSADSTASYPTEPAHEPPTDGLDLVQAPASDPTARYTLLDTPGLISKVYAPQQHYYVVVGSYIDVDLAMDHAQQLSTQGIDVSILYPQQGKHFFYVGVEESSSYEALHEKWDDLQSLYGTTTWIVRY
ncbi:MAG: hypothetical protein AAF706_03115 [Bacteroidota bacterium]